MAAPKGNSYASFNNTHRFLNKKKETGVITKPESQEEFAQLLNLMSLEC